ncbi:hypothetical protein EMIT0P100_120195 [Pseudomonas sp. IT-P100]
MVCPLNYRVGHTPMSIWLLTLTGCFGSFSASRDRQRTAKSCRSLAIRFFAEDQMNLGQPGLAFGIPLLKKRLHWTLIPWVIWIRNPT